MKNVLCILVLLGVCAPASANTKNALLEQLERFNQAFTQADVQTLDCMLHKQYQHTNSGNPAFGKQAWLTWVGSRTERVRNAQLVYSRYETEDLNVVMGDKMAVVTGRNRASGTDNSSPFEVDIRFTHVWVWQDNRWQRLAFHDAPAEQ